MIWHRMVLLIQIFHISIPITSWELSGWSAWSVSIWDRGHMTEKLSSMDMRKWSRFCGSFPKSWSRKRTWRWSGRKLTCCGDEPYNSCEEAYAKDSTWLLHEAFCLHGQADIFHPYEKHHSTVKDACELAEQLHVKNLLLYHTEDRNLAKRKDLYTEEGKRYYHGNLYVPEDLEKISL